QGQRRVCAYHGTSAPPGANDPFGVGNRLPRQQPGVRAIDISDHTKPYNTAYLTTSAMLDPWESLKINDRRQLLGAVNGQNGGGGADFDVYDVSGDCRYPQLLSSTAMVPPEASRLLGHEGSWAPDGLTYYGSDLFVPSPPDVPGGQGVYYAIDTTNTTQPRFITSWHTPLPGTRPHGLAINDEGTRGYFAS